MAMMDELLARRDEKLAAQQEATLALKVHGEGSLLYLQAQLANPLRPYSPRTYRLAIKEVVRRRNAEPVADGENLEY